MRERRVAKPKHNPQDSMVVKFFEEDSTVYNRALQIWLVLIGMAHNRQTTTYGALARTLGYTSPGAQFMTRLLERRAANTSSTPGTMRRIGSTGWRSCPPSSSVVMLPALAVKGGGILGHEVLLFRVNVRLSGRHKCHSVRLPWYQMMT